MRIIPHVPFHSLKQTSLHDRLMRNNLIILQKTSRFQHTWIRKKWSETVIASVPEFVCILQDSLRSYLRVYFLEMD